MSKFFKHFLLILLLSSCSVFEKQVSIYDQQIASRPSKHISSSDLESIEIGEKVKVVFYDNQISIDGQTQVQKEVRGGTLKEMDSNGFTIERRFLGKSKSHELTFNQLDQIRYQRNKGKVWGNRLIVSVPIISLGIIVPLVITHSISE